MPSTSAAERKRELDGMSARLTAKFSGVPHLSVGAAAAAQREGSRVVFIDARTPEERAVSTIPGSLTVEQFEAREGELRDARCVAFCTIGYRSSQLAEKLRKRGIDAANLEGSILAWVSEWMRWRACGPRRACRRPSHSVRPPSPQTHAGLPLVTLQDGVEVETTKVHVVAERWALQGEGYVAVTFRHGLFSYAASAVSSFASKLFGGTPDGG